MSDYLVHIEVLWPPDGDPDLLEATKAAEAIRRSELIEAGLLLRLWREPGRWANWTLWSSGSADELQDAVGSLPFYPWMRVTVHALIPHEADPGPGSRPDTQTGSLSDA